MSAFWVALPIAAVLTGLLIPVLRRVGLADQPNERSSHEVVTPRGGGLAVLAAVLAGALVAGAGRDAWLLVVVVLVLAGVGLLDDVRSLPSAARLLTQLVVAVLVVAVLVPDADGVLASQAAFAVLGGLGFVAYVNAFNFMDGINSISALNAVVTGGWNAWLGVTWDLPELVVVGAASCGAALGFLPWNLAGRIFLGDVGSYGLGALFAATGLWAWAHGVPPLLIGAPLLVYFADTGAAIVRRRFAGHALGQAHRDHVYQRLVRAGWSHLGAATLTAALALVICTSAALLRQTAWPVWMTLTPTLLGAYLGVGWQVGRHAQQHAPGRAT